MNDDVAVTIDISNRRTGIVVWGNEGPLGTHALGTDPNRTADELVVLMAAMIDQAPASVTRCAIACVVPGLDSIVATAARTLFEVDPLVVRPGVRTGLDIRTEDPRELGPDRIANAVAAIEQYGNPVIIIDMATALTFDVVGSTGEYLGAIIAPGPEVALSALVDRAARLGPIDLSTELEPPAIAGSTADAVRTGILGGAIGMIEGLVARIHDELGPSPVVATGEPPLAPAIAARCPVIDSFDPLLTHRGLLSILKASHNISNKMRPIHVLP